MYLIVACDGGYKRIPGVPGIATYGWILYQEDYRTLFKDNGIVAWGRRTHAFMAEYGAVAAALRWLRHTPLPQAASIEVRSDCRDMVERLTNQRPFRRGKGVVTLHKAVLRLVEILQRQGHRITFRHVPRRQVSEAHCLCRRIYRQRLAEPVELTQVRLKEFLLRKPKAAAGELTRSGLVFRAIR